MAPMECEVLGNIIGVEINSEERKRKEKNENEKRRNKRKNEKRRKNKELRVSHIR